MLVARLAGGEGVKSERDIMGSSSGINKTRTHTHTYTTIHSTLWSGSSGKGHTYCSSLMTTVLLSVLLLKSEFPW